MKNLKPLYLLALILIFNLLTTSCSDDDDGGNESGFGIELFVNDTKQSIHNLIDNPIIYSDNELQFNTYFGSKDRGDIVFLNFKGISFNNLSIGDDLAVKASNCDYNLFYENDTYMLFKNHPVLSNNQYNEYKGQAIVKELDQNNGTIKVEFSNMKIPIFDVGDPYKQPEKAATVKGVFSGKIDFD